MALSTFLFLICGLILLTAGAEFLVRGAAALAGMMRISSLTIGLTVVAFGTSAPEFAVSVQSAMAGQGELALGNVLGSNIFNILVILGVSALITPLIVSQQLVRFDVPLMIGVSGLMLFFALDGTFSRVDGIILFAGLLTYVCWSVWQSRKEGAAVRAEYDQEYASPIEGPTWRNVCWNLGIFVGGLGMLVLGSHWLVESAVSIARVLGVSELIIGITVVAAGTSLPEAATSVVAAMKGERDIAVGNAIGSNLFNILGVLGLASAISPNGITVAPAALSFDIPVMVAVAVACLPVFFNGNLIARWEGALFLAYYIVYAVYLVLATTQHDALPMYNFVVAGFALPLTVITFGVITVRCVRQRRKKAGSVASVD